jgi:hypothetical protein
MGVEGTADQDATGLANVVYRISKPSDAVTYFGAASTLTNLVNNILDRGVAPVYAIASKVRTAGDAVPATLAQRQAAWAYLEAEPLVRIRMTDSLTTSDHTALAASCDNANKINHKQFAVVGMAAGISKAALLTAATSLSSKRAVLVAPGVYDEYGVLQNGLFAATCVACEVSKNTDLSDDLDTMVIPGMTSIERDTAGMPIFRRRVVSNVAANDMEDLLQGGVSPLYKAPYIDGGVAISHLRTTFIGDTTFDSLSTRLIMDQIFVLVRQYCYDFAFLRRPNTPTNRAVLAAGVNGLLNSHSDWIAPKIQNNGSLGYGVNVTASADQRQMIVSYEGQIVRGVQTILVSGSLEIAV